MTLLTFILGLALGFGFCFWQQQRLQRQQRQILELLPQDATSSSFPLIYRLRQAIAFANQQRAVLEELLESKQQLLEAAPVGYLQVDEDNHLLWCNKKARQLLQIDRWQPGQIRLLLELVRSYELDQLIEQTRHRQQPATQEWVFHPACVDGTAMSEVRSLTLRASSWPLSQRQVGVFLENRQPLVELSQSRNQWVSDLAHELRTPLTSIRLVAEALQGRLKPPESRWVEQLLQEINRLIDLVQNWLELSHLEKNPSQSLTYDTVELRSLLGSVWQSLEPLAQQKQLCLAYTGPDTLTLRADESRLTQVFLNLLDNSIKYSPPQAAIRVKVALLDGTDIDSNDLSQESLIQIDIIDSGSGFSPSDLPHVFKRLYRGDGSRYRAISISAGSPLSTKTSGSGLGLSIVQEIIQAHGGVVTARNHPETGGAWLQIQLPYLQWGSGEWGGGNPSR
ncbi:MAG TPA: histidine kinase [Cyanobacteria bacterium UBA8803]|nr:histidine kinase [Cyanobacteria bacterium UBA9273]HBL60757.1 histidine kinase [Cyanobacteria bacterium UBA8803]